MIAHMAVQVRGDGAGSDANGLLVARVAGRQMANIYLVCPATNVGNVNHHTIGRSTSVRIGDTTIIARGVDPKNPGFKIIAGSGVVELYGKPFPYVGHVTLLK